MWGLGFNFYQLWAWLGLTQVEHKITGIYDLQITETQAQELTWGQETQDLLMGKKNYVMLLLLFDGAIDGFKKSVGQINMIQN